MMLVTGILLLCLAWAIEWVDKKFWNNRIGEKLVQTLAIVGAICLGLSIMTWMGRDWPSLPTFVAGVLMLVGLGVWVACRLFDGPPSAEEWNAAMLATKRPGVPRDDETSEFVPAYHVGKGGCGKPAMLFAESFVEVVRGGGCPPMLSRHARHIDMTKIDTGSPMQCDSCGAPFLGLVPARCLSFNKPEDFDPERTMSVSGNEPDIRIKDVPPAWPADVPLNLENIRCIHADNGTDITIRTLTTGQEAILQRDLWNVLHTLGDGQDALPNEIGRIEGFVFVRAAA